MTQEKNQARREDPGAGFTTDYGDILSGTAGQDNGNNLSLAQTSLC